MIDILDMIDILEYITTWGVSELKIILSDKYKENKSAIIALYE